MNKKEHYSGLNLNQDKATQPQTVQIETFAKFLFSRQPKSKHRFTAVSDPNHS